LPWCKINFWSSTSTPLYYGANLYCNGALVTDVDCELFGNYTFCGYRNLQSVIIAEGKTTIPYAAFWNCTNLKSIVIPNSVNTIEENAFKDCTQIKDVHFGGSSADRTDKMRILSGNECLTNATWHYAFTSTLLSYWHLFLLGAVVIAGGILLVIFIKKGFI